MKPRCKKEGSPKAFFIGDLPGNKANSQHQQRRVIFIGTPATAETANDMKNFNWFNNHYKKIPGPTIFIGAGKPE